MLSKLKKYKINFNTVCFNFKTGMYEDNESHNSLSENEKLTYLKLVGQKKYVGMVDPPDMVLLVYSLILKDINFCCKGNWQNKRKYIVISI